MDSYLEASGSEPVTRLRHEIHGYLERHADVSADLDAADLAVGELLANVDRHAPGQAPEMLTDAGNSSSVAGGRRRPPTTPSHHHHH